MAIDDLPLPVVTFLNAIGVPWPYLNEDTVSEFAGLVREFRQAVQATHQDATETVASITRAHQSVSTERMQSGWDTLTGRHVDELMAGCTVLADALEPDEFRSLISHEYVESRLMESGMPYRSAEAAAWNGDLQVFNPSHFGAHEVAPIAGDGSLRRWPALGLTPPATPVVANLSDIEAVVDAARKGLKL